MKNSIAILFVFLSTFSFSQTTTFNDMANFSTSNQGMWGVGAFTFSKEQYLFNLNPSLDFNQNLTQNFNFLGINFGTYGMTLDAGFSMTASSKFYVNNITGGTVDVDYPVKTIITYPQVNTINRGEWITIETDFILQNNWKLQTYFPPTANVGLDFNFGFNVFLNANMYMGGGPINIVNMNTTFNKQIDLFKISPTNSIYPGMTYDTTCAVLYCGSYNQECVPSASFPTPTGACKPVFFDNPNVPTFLNSPIRTQLGLTAMFDVPRVTTTDNLSGNCLTASGNYRYVNQNLEVLKFFGNFIPGATGTALQNLSGSQSVGPFTINYTMLSTYFSFSNNTYQEFDFCPTIKSNFHFPVQVFYEEINNVGIIVSSGQSQDITITVGNDLRIKYPCNYDFIDVTLDYDLRNTFRNHTWDEIQGDFTVEALAFQFTMDPIVVIPAKSWTVCWPWPIDDCSTFGWSDQVIPGFNIGNGQPLFAQTFPIFSVPYNWIDETWELPGFQNIPGTSFTLDAMPYLANSVSTDVDCYGGNNGAMQVTVTNGVAPFNFIWSDGTTTTSASQTSSNPNLVAGPNSVVVEDVNGCQATTSQLITEPVEALSIYNQVVNNVDCNGNSTGSINLSVVGGTPPYTYIWSPLVSGSNVANNLPAANYAVTITDSKGCSINDSFTITEPTVLVANAIINKNVNCFGGIDGSATMSVSGGAYPFTYAWSTGDNVQTVSNLPAGNHSCTVTDVNGCSVLVPVVITQPAQAIQLSISQTPTSCFNVNDGSINLTPIGGTTPYNFNWYNSANQMLSQHVEDPINLLADTYLVSVTDTNGCFDTISVEVTQPDELLISNAVITDVLCNGDLTGSVDIDVVGGTVPYNYSWNNGSSSQDLISVGAGNYDVTVADLNGCNTQQSYIISEPDLPLSATSVNTDVLCFGDNTAAIDLSVEGGTLPYIYSWNNGNTNEDLSNLTAGNYSVLTTDGNNCQLTFSTVINQPIAPLSATNVVTNVTCYDSLNGSINLSVVGGTQPYFYQWNNSAEVILADTTANPQNLGADMYSVLVTDTNNCTINQNIIVSQPDSIGLSYSSVNILCTNDNTGSIDLTVVGGTPTYTYNWSNGSATQDLNTLLAGNYSVVVTDVNGCSNSIDVNLTEPSEVVSLSIDKKDVLCFGGATAWASASVNGGVSPYTVLWSNGDTNFLADTLIAGVYTVTATDMNGCTVNSGTVINEPATPISFTNTVTDASCFNAWDGIIDLSPAGGVTPYQIVYGDTLLNTYNNLDNSYQLNGLHAGVYYARIIDRNGCEYEELITVNEPDSLMVNGIVTDALCFGSADGIVDLIVTGGTLPYSYLWSNSTQNEDLTGVTAGWYNVEVTDFQNCITKGVYFIGQPDEIIVTGTTTDPTCRDNEDGTITIFVEGGTPGYSYLWSNNEITESVYGLASGTYVLEVTDEHVCIKTDTFNINPSIIDCIQPPTAFTPDGDGINDTWIIENLTNYPNAVVQIFNKWGNLLYETNGEYMPWNGYYEGKRLPTATYYYIINLNNGDAPYSGPITIVINE